eukprot:768364-Hanusia_phi.AAC.4
MVRTFLEHVSFHPDCTTEHAFDVLEVAFVSADRGRTKSSEGKFDYKVDCTSESLVQNHHVFAVVTLVLSWWILICDENSFFFIDNKSFANGVDRDGYKEMVET